MNVRSAYLHLLSDTLSSVAVIVGGLAIRYWHILWIDPAITVLISAYILKEGFRILKHSVEILMEASPEINLEDIKKSLKILMGLGTSITYIFGALERKTFIYECHIEVEDMKISEAQGIIDEAEEGLRKFGITHLTSSPS